MVFGIILVLSVVALSCARLDELSPSVLSSDTGTRKLEATSVFTIFGGTGCQVEDGCLVSHRRRRYDVNTHCDVSISPDAGSLVFESYSITDWCSLSFFNLSTYPLAQWRQPGFTSCFYAWCITARDDNGFASPGYVVEPVDYMRWQTVQSDKSNGQYSGWKLCPMGSKVGPSQIPSREEMEAPFEAIGGCYVSGRCLLSHRRRGDGYLRGDWCSVQVGHGVGPLSVPEFETVQDSDKLIVNGVDFSGSHGPQGIRPIGAIFWSTNTGGRQGWTICAPLPYNTTSSISTMTTTAQPVLGVHSVRSLWNGVDGVFDVLSNETAKMVARLACESHYGEDSCTEGSCRCFRYFYRAGAVSCNCDKAKDEYEWVFGNDWCHGVSEDYSPVDWNETGGILLDANDYTFVRRRATGCGIGSWELVAAAIGVGINLPHHHLVLDLRASSYSHASSSLDWPNLVPNGPNGILNDPFFVPEEQSFIFGGSIEGADTSFASVNLPYLPMLTLSAWVKFPNPGPQYSGTAVHTLSTSAGFGLMTLQLTTERANSWLHLVAVWKNNRVTHFLNGQSLNAEVLSSGSRPTTADTMLIGRLPGTAVALAGIPVVEISDVAVFDRIMTKREVGKIFAQGRPSAGNAKGPSRKCRYTGGYESLGEILATTTTTSTWQAFTATGSGCRVMRGTCVENVRRRRAYTLTSDVQCTVTVNYMNETILLSAPQFNLGGEMLQFKNTAGPEYTFTGSYGPDGSEQPESIVWKEQGDAKTQWRICAHLRPDANATASHKADSYLDCLLNNGEDPEQEFFESILGTSTSCAVLANSTYCEAEVLGSYKFHRICPLSCNATSPTIPQLQTNDEHSEPEEIDDTPAWTIRSGLCQVQRHSCVSSPLYPLAVEGNLSCLLEAPTASLISVDILGDDHGNQSFQVFDGTTWAQYTPGESNIPASSISWSSSDTPTYAWMICAKAARTTAGNACTNDESWTDALYGDGSKSCSYFASHTAWCFLRGLYSVEVINACPQACGTCSSAFHQLDSQSCGEATKLDESQAADHIATAEACFRHCVAHEHCTHFQWQAGVACSRFRGCSPQAAGSAAAFSIPGKVRSYDGPLITGLTWDGLAGWRYSGKCTVHLDEAGCRRVAQVAKMAYVDMELDEKLVTAPSCVFSKQAGEFFMRDSAGLECSLLYPCICSEWATESLPLAKSVPARSTPAIPATRKGMLLAVEKEARNETFEDCPQVHVTSCLGKRREFRQFRVPHLLGPKLHPFPADWDGDGDMDLLLGRWSGELVYMENVGGELDFAAARGLSRTAAGTSCVQTWQYPSESKNCGHWCCYYQALGDVCLNGKDSWVTCSPASAWGVTTGDAMVPTAVDMDNDGDLDLLVASCDGTLQYWIRNGVHNLTRVVDPAANPFEGLLANRESACFFPDIVDWDHDGDLDVLMGTTTGRIEMFENRDGKFHHMLNRESEDPFRKVVMEGLAVPCAVDWDADGDLDLLVGSTSGDVQVFYRTEFGVLTAAGRVPGVQVEGNSVPRAADWDGDGTLDLFVVDGETGELTIWISTMVEADKLVEEKGIFNPFTDLPLGHLPKPQVVDFDGNGRLDLFIVDDDSKPKYFPSFDEFFVRSATTPVNTLLESWSSVSTQHVVDWDLDGDYDLLFGQNGGGVFWHEYDAGNQSFAPRQLLFSDGAVGAYSVHAVDWDNDGDKDLVVGASGVDVPRRLRMTGLPLPEWNGWYREQGPSMIIGGHGVFISDTNEWVLALCSTGRYWYLFQNSEAALQANRADACQGAVAKMLVDRSLLDRGLVGEQNLWQAQGAIGKYIQSYEQYVTSDGTERSPHCHVCSEAQKANGCGGCNVSAGVQHDCAVAICKRWGFDSAEVSKFRPEPIEECSCANTDPEHIFDLFGKKCGVYSPEWCGNYNTMNFSSQQMCCTCGGGIHGDGSNIQHWVVQAKCFHDIQPWTPVPNATVAELLPGPEEFSQNALRYFERTAPASLVERLGDANPFKAVDMLPGSRVYPDIVDWNGDGRLDLILGSYSREFFSFTTDGTQERPHCGASTAAWDRSMKQQCATAICRMAGFSRGSVTDESFSAAPTSGLAFSLVSGSLEEVAKVASAVQLAGRCAQGGFVRYFQQQEDGAMEEKLEDANPFSVLSEGFPSRSAVVQPLRFDPDDKLDAVFADDQGTLRFFTLGQTCQRSQSCSSKGVCDPVLRRCTCASGHNNSDCSQCMEGYFSFQALKADVSSCQPCPGFGEENGTCAGRGTCDDDTSAQDRFRSDNSSTGSITAIIGSGNCTCNSDHFYGVDHRKLSSCREGQCPAGFEEKDQVGLSSKTCSRCEKGFFKAAAGGEECTACEAGNFSARPGSTECQVCPAGEFQDEAGKSKCKRCAQTSFSTGGTASCTTCPVGRYAGDEGMSECAQCPPGKWSSQTGSDRCQDCPEGKYGTGLAPCSQCVKGSYSKVPPRTTCVFCPQGRYSEVIEGASIDVCLPCSIGKFSGAVGAGRMKSCTACEYGATTAAEASVSKQRCVQPDRGNFSCVAGRHCAVQLDGNELRSPHQLAFWDAQLRVHSSDKTDNGTHYDWQGNIVVEGGTYKLAWCPGLITDKHAACNGIPDFAFEVGLLDVIGPQRTSFKCVRGRSCEHLGPVTGLGLLASDLLQLQTSCSSGDPVPITAASSSWLATGMALDAAGALTFGFGPDFVSVNPSERGYEVCWCATGRGQQGGCADSRDFHVLVGSLTIQGPLTGQEMVCYLGQECRLTGIQGIEMAVGDRLMVLDRCGRQGQPPKGVPSGGIAETNGMIMNSGMDFDFFLPLGSFNRTTEVLQSIPGLYRLCYCRPKAGGCESAADFNASTGFFRAKGPYNDHSIGCFVGSTCALENMRGIGLGDRDGVEIQLGDGACGSTTYVDEHPAGFQAFRVLAKNRGQDFSFGALPATATPGRYRLCWRSGTLSQGPFLANVGLLHAACPGGTYRLVTADRTSCETCPQGFYCPGGTEGGNWVDDKLLTCKPGSTTVGTSSTGQADCVCREGFRLDAGACIPCSEGKYKAVIANDATCTLCPNSTTSVKGASSAGQCFSEEQTEEAGNSSQSNAEVFVVEGVLQFPACMDDNLLSKAQVQLKQVLSDSMRVDKDEVKIVLGPEPASCHSVNVSRRLQQAFRNVTYSVSLASQREAERLSKSVNPAAIQANLQETVGIRVEVFTDPFIAKQLLNCTLRGAGYSFPLGSQPTSTDDCECAVGYGKPDADTDSCLLCGIGLHKKKIGNEQCSPCGTVPGHDGAPLRLTTMKRGATGEQFCTCLKGYFAPPNSTTPPGTCNLCGVGYYCEGGSARQQCPPGETTTISKAVTVTDCVCVAGLTRGPLRNGTYPCEPCPPEKFKADDSDDPCSQDCPANSIAKPGSTSRRDCFCKPGYYYENSTDTCRACPADGVLCPGGFDPPGSFVHAAPKAKAGYFMTGYALAERCFIVDGDGESVCLAGATASNQTNACGGLQTGDLCGACKHLSARDLGDEPCEPCAESYADWMHVINLNFDLILKAGFGIFLGSRSLTSPTGAKRMEAVIFRILLQWITASSVLGTFDLASVRLFDWSTEDQTDAAVEGENEDVALLTAEGLSFKFRFPEWFQPVWRSLMAITGTIPGPVSPQISLECLIQKQMSATHRSGGQLLGPPLWWLMYPLLVMVWVAILCLVLAKMVFPFAARFIEKAKRGLSSRLTAVGVSSVSSQRALETMTAARVQQILQDPDVMADDGSLLEAFGGEVYIEAASQVLVEQTGPQFLNMLQQLVNDAVADEHATGCAQEVLSGGLEFLGTFVTRVVRLMRSHNKDLLCDVFSDPHSVLPVVKTFIEEKGIKSADDGGAARQSQSPRECSTKSSRRGSTDAGAVYPVFGLFRDTTAANVLRDALPLYLVTMYSIWDLVTRRMLGLLQARTIKVGTDAAVQGRWLYDMRFSVFRAEHIPVCVVSIVGLTLWSLAFLVMLFVVLKRGKHFLQEHNFVRKFGYFYNGLEPNMFWWEVVLKKGDILLLYIVTFTELFHDPKAKLIMYLGFAGFFWAAHNMYHPYDDRQNKLADRLEDFGLMTRFVTVFLLQILIMVSRHRQMNAIMAIAIVVFNVRFLCVIGFVLAVELPDTEARISLRSKQSSMDSGFVGRCTRILTLAFKYTVGLIGNMILRVFSVLARSKQLAAKKVPHIMWQGPGLDLIVVTHEAERLPWHERLFTIFVSYLYKLGEHDQKTYVANSLAQFWEYIMNNSNCHHLPACIMDIFFVLPTALKKERAQIHSDVDMVPLHLRVAKRVHDILMEHHQQRISEVVQAQRTRTTSAWSREDGSESQRLGASEHLDGGIASRESGKAEKARTSSGEGSESTRLGASVSLENVSSPRATSKAEKVRTSSDFSLTEVSQSQRLGGSVSLENSTAIRATSRDRARSRTSSAAGAYARSIGSSARDMGRGKSFSVSEGLPDHVHSGEDFNASLLFVQCLSRNEVHDFIVEASIDEETSNMGKQTSI